jgi:large subunit ribosomal protein L7Ae
LEERKMAEVSKELVELGYEIIEIAKSSGKIRKGTNEVTKAIEKQKAKLVMVAADVTPPEIVMHLPLLAKEKNIPCIKAGTKEELGAAAGLGLGTSSIAVVDEGEAKEQLKKLIQQL